MSNLIALPANTELVGDFRIERVLGAGGFGITYLADEIALARAVTIKEYFPADFAARTNDGDAAPRSQGSNVDYQWGLDRFIEEAQILARFTHPNIVRVYRYFRANNTAYMVLHFEEGQSLKAWLKSLDRAPRQKELDAILGPLLDALAEVHKADFLHRDIAPDNIIIRNDGSPVLIDFGSARGEMAGHSKTVSALVKPGYSPYEQYAETSRQQGPWTDIYALAATLYMAVTGKRPPDSPSRMVADEKRLARDGALSAYRTGFLNAIDRALNLAIEDRPQSIAEWRGELLAPDHVRKASKAKDEPAKAGGSWLPGFGWNASSPAHQPSGADTPDAGSPVVPPRPDAPGRPGGLLDYMDRLKQPDGQNGQDGPAAPQARASEPASPSPQPAAGNQQRFDPDPEVKSRTREKAASPAVAPSGTVKLTSPPVFNFAGRKRQSAEPDRDQKADKARAPRPPKVEARRPNAKPNARPKKRADPVDPPMRRAGFFRSGTDAATDKKLSPDNHHQARNAKGVKLKHDKAAALPALRPRKRSWLAARDTSRGSITTSWRGLAVKLVIGIVVAGVIVANQDRLREYAKGMASDEQNRIATAQKAVPPPAQNPRFAGPNPLPQAIAAATEPRARTATAAQSQRLVSDAQAPQSTLSPATQRPTSAAPSRQASNPLPAAQPQSRAPSAITASSSITTAALRRPEPTTNPSGSLQPIPPGDAAVPAEPLPPIKTEQNPLLRIMTGHAGAITAVTTTSDGRYAITAGEDATVRLWDLASGEATRSIDLKNGPASTIAVQNDLLATGHRGGFINIWNLKTGTRIVELRRNEADIWDLAFTSVEGRLAAASHDWKAVLWDLKTPGAPLHVFDAHENAVLALAISPDGRYLATGGADKRVRLWNLDTLDAVRTYTRQREFVSALAFSSDGRTLAAAGLNGGLSIGRANQRRLSRRLRGHSEQVNALAFTPDGATLATASSDGTLRLWDVKRRRTIKTLPGHNGKVAGLALTRDGTKLLTAGTDSTLRLWSLKAALD